MMELLSWKSLRPECLHAFGFTLSASRFRLHAYDSAMAAKGFDPHDTVSIETLRPDGAQQVFELKTSGIAYACTFVVA
jgi:hypothetical protein